MTSEDSDLNIFQCRDFVVKHRPICCGKQVDKSVNDISMSYQFFICRGCGQKSKIQYWPLYKEQIRDEYRRWFWFL